VPGTPGQTQMPTLSPLPEPRRSPRHHGEAKMLGTKDVDSQSTLSDANTVGTLTTLAVTGPPSEVTAITQSTCVGAARALVWHTLSENPRNESELKHGL
jgi:hypothetical protein